MPDETMDATWMQLALELAAQGEGRVEPNPMVGCVLVSSSGELIGKGFHTQFGMPHAEREALQDARRQFDDESIAGATAFVTLEPCCHHGKTPPCTDALIEARVARVVVAALDPFPEVAGKGVDFLRRAGIEVVTGLLEQDAAKLVAPYLKRVRTGLPWVIAKWAMSLDGKTATRERSSKWITNAQSRKRVHEIRGRVDAILVGSGTVVADDPSLTARNVQVHRKALRVVMSTKPQLPESSKLLETAQETPTLVAYSTADEAHLEKMHRHGVNVFPLPGKERDEQWRALLRHLSQEYAATNILVEGGSQIMGSLHDGQFIDQCEVFIAPKSIGGCHALPAIAGNGIGLMAEANRYDLVGCEQLGSDIHLSYRKIQEIE